MKGDFSAGKPVPLSIPSCLQREWGINGVEGERLAEFKAEILGSLGYGGRKRNFVGQKF